MKLTDAKVKRLTPGVKPYKVADGRGLFLLVQPTGGRLWRFAYRFEGKQKLLALGVYPDVGLAVARELHQEARRKLAQNVDPSAAKRAEKFTGATFRDVTALWFENWKTDKSARYRDYVLRRMKDDVYPAIGDKPISSVKAVEVVALCKRIEQRGALEIARRCKESVSMVFRWAVGHGYCERNPLADVRSGDVLKPSKKGHHARVEDARLPAVVAALMSHPGITTRMACKLTMYTALRTANVINLEWAWVNLGSTEIRFPADVMKMRSDFICVLSAQSVAVLAAMKQISNDARYVFPGAKQGKPLSNGAMLKALRDAGFGGKHTMHAFRAVFTTWARENGFDREVIETSLHHHKRGVSAHYDFAAYLPERRALTQAWADHLDALTPDSSL